MQSNSPAQVGYHTFPTPQARASWNYAALHLRRIDPQSFGSFISLVRYRYILSSVQVYPLFGASSGLAVAVVTVIGLYPGAAQLQQAGCRYIRSFL